MSSLTRVSSTIRPRKHDVFLSFRGEDTRTAFTDHLYDALTRQGIDTFRDDENLRAGDFIKPELLKGIEESRFGIVILSSDYATSTWCLEELAYIVDCMEKMGLLLIPVFYYVDPSDVRYQRNTFDQAFAKHETSNRVAPEKVKTWRAALRKVGDISGLHIDGTKYESEEISKIVRRIFKDLQDTLPTDATGGLIGIESRVEELKSLLNMESNDVRFIGIYGMSGMGKTTLAEVVYEGIRNQFQGCSFIGNIKDISRENVSDLCKLQQKLLVDILKDEHIRIGSVIEGVSMLKKRLRERKIIIILDDVNHQEQLKVFAGEREWFGLGSRVIMTTTNEDLLKLHRVDMRYKCEGLNFSDATRLFNLLAFSEGQPKTGYEKLSNNIVKLAGGLPLALNAFGSLLFGKGEIFWRDTLKKLQQIPEKQVCQRLEICYDRLDTNEKDIFIYIACFLKGRNQVLVNDILENIGLHPDSGIDILINRSLITINYDDSVWMHDLLQQMGWEVLRKEFPRHPGKRVGLKRRGDIIDICTSEEKGTKAIEIINQEQYGAEVENCIGDHESFSKMKKLKFLRISNVVFPYGLEYLSNDLRILEWYGCSLTSFPQTFGPKQIYELDMRSSLLEKLWEKDIDLPNLRSINLCGSKDLTKISNLTSTPKLLKINLEGCTNLVELHKSLLAHKSLRYVNLKGCGKLRSLGNNMEMEIEMEMDGLEALLLSGCSELEHIPEFGENMKRLEDLYLDGTKIKRLPESLGKMCSLRKLDVSETAIEELPSFLLHLERLRLLHIHGCRLLTLTKTFHSMELSLLGLKELDLSACNLSTISDGIGLLYSLKELDLSKNDFVMLPASISLLSNLRMLCLNSCTRLESLPKLSKVDEDALFGLQIRFSYYISRGLDVSKFRLSSHGINRTVSCLNCPKLIENQSGRGLVDTIFQKYLQVRTESRVLPEAIFEIVAAGSEIPWWFKLGKSPPVILKGIETKHHGLGDVFDFDYDFYTCIGVVLCAVIVVPHPLGDIEVKYEVVAHIHVVGQCWRIPVPVNFLEAELETQLVWFWSVTDDLRRTIDPNKMTQFEISFSVEPEDGNLEVKKFGLRFLRRGDVERLLRGPRISINGISSIMKMISLFCGQKMRCYKEVCEAKMRWYKEVCEANQELQSLNSSFQNHTCKVTTILATGFKHGSISLDSIREIIESLLEMNQKVVIVILKCKEEMRQDGQLQLFSLVSQFFKMSLPMLELCTDFMKFLKGRGDKFVIVQVAMQQIEAKRRAGTLNYLETIQQLIDLEAAMVLEGAKVPLSADFNALFQSFFDGRATMPWDYADQKMRNTKSTSVKAWHKVSHVTTAATLSTVLISAVVALRSALSPAVRRTMKFVHGMRTLFDEWLAGYEYESWDEGYENGFWTNENDFFTISDGDNFVWEHDVNYRSWENGMRITDFDGIPNLLEELKIKMSWLSDSVAVEDEGIVILTDEIKERISGFRNAIGVMSTDVYERISSIRQASTEALLSNYETESSNAKQKGEIHEDVLKLRRPRISIYRIPIIMEMISKFRSQKKRMRWYKEVCEANQELQSLNLSFQNHTCKVINILTSGFKHGSISLDSICEVIESLLEMNQEVVKVILECKEEILKEWTLLYFVRYFFEMSKRMLELCTDFMKFLKCCADSWLIVQMAMQQIEAKRREGTLNYSETMQQLIDLEAAMVSLSVDFYTLFGDILCGDWDYALKNIHKTEPSIEACKVLLLTTAATLSTVLISAVVALRSALSPTVRGTTEFVHGMCTLFDEWLAGYEYKGWDDGYGSFREMNKDFEYETSLDRYFKYESREMGLRITDFDGILELVEELKSKIELQWLLHLSRSVAKEEEEIVILMNELKTRISGFTNTIEHMSSHAYERICYLTQTTIVLQSDYEIL